MKMEISFLRSVVARRIFFLFIACALVPIAIMAVLAFTQVEDQLEQQCLDRLYQTSKTTGMAIYERMFLLEDELLMFRPHVRLSDNSSFDDLYFPYGQRLTQRFSALYLASPAGGVTSFFGEPASPLPLAEEQRRFLTEDKTVVTVRHNDGGSPVIYLVHLVDPAKDDEAMLIGQVKSEYLWGIGEVNTLPAMTELTVLDQDGKLLVTTIPLHESFFHNFSATDFLSHRRQFSWEIPGRDDFLATAWAMFLKANYASPSWSIILSQSKVDGMAPLLQFQKIFPRATLMSLGIIILLSLVQIRKSLVPLEKLKKGIARLTNRDFSSSITVDSGDEFQELAESFNSMSERLHRQFNTLETISEIDRAILSSLDRETIIKTALNRLFPFLPCQVLAIGLVHSEHIDHGLLYLVKEKSDHFRSAIPFSLSGNDLELLGMQEGFRWLDDIHMLPAGCNVLSEGGISAFLLFPLRSDLSLSGFLVFGFQQSPSLAHEDLVQARNLADQIAVALSQAQLHEDLSQMQSGTVLALARTVDAKSSWTAGHSERVTTLALNIANLFDLDDKSRENLRWASLLHDIGKIGVAAAILDKVDPLEYAEYEVLKEHPGIGARILEPIPAYADVVPIVRQHHECYNGKGYPAGLSGEKITLEARILAVADVYDALSSDRPYRDGWENERVLTFLKKGAGEQFDPDVVRAFLEIMEWEHESESMAG